MSKFIKLTFVEGWGGTVFVVNTNDLVMIQDTVGLDIDTLQWRFDCIPSGANALAIIGREHAQAFFVTETVAEIYAMLGGVG